MISISAAEFAKVVSGKLHLIPDEMMINEIPVINSHKATKGTFFAAFKGDNVDGHDFVESAIQSGAKFALVSKQVNSPSIQVEDVGQALLDLTTYVRSKLTGLKLVGITGSQGKTTTKEFLASILQLAGNTVATEGNFNTDIGVPLTILRCDEQSKYCIVEMGARHVGDIAKLTRVAAPDVGVVLVVGRAHLGEFGSVEALAKTKAELITNLLPNKVAVLGSYDKFTPKMADHLELNKIVFGEGQSVRAADIEMHGGFAHFDLVTPTGRNPVSLQVLGEHQIPNALGAAAAAYALEISNDQIATGLITATLSTKWRMEIEELAGLKIINDFYNANPESTMAAIKTLVLLSQESGGASWAVLGKMHELGEAEISGHGEVVKYCQKVGVDHLVAVGTDLYKSEKNEDSDKHLLIHNCANADTVLELVSNFSAGDVVLLKASRSEKFEDLANLLKTKWSGGVA
jgi:UDP-N-acetylmuramoyl-tripeptide--D-alanyl-D-alanine ligase